MALDLQIVIDNIDKTYLFGLTYVSTQNDLTTEQLRKFRRLVPRTEFIAKLKHFVRYFAFMIGKDPAQSCLRLPYKTISLLLLEKQAEEIIQLGKQNVWAYIAANTEMTEEQKSQFTNDEGIYQFEPVIIDDYLKQQIIQEFNSGEPLHKLSNKYCIMPATIKF